MSRKFISLMLSVFLVFALMLPVSAATSSMTQIDLDDGSVLYVPTKAVLGDYFVILEVVGFSGHYFMVYAFEDEYTSNSERSNSQRDEYVSASYSSRGAALMSNSWSVSTNSGAVDFANLSNNVTICYSSYDICDWAGNVIVPKSVEVSSGEETSDYVGNPAPAIDYTGLFPDEVASYGDYITDNWLIWREEYVSGSSTYEYYLVFLPDDYTNAGFGSYGTYGWLFQGTSFHVYKLTNTTDTDAPFSDDVLNSLDMSYKKWAYSYTDTGKFLIDIDREIWKGVWNNDTESYDFQLSQSISAGNWYVASSFSANLSSGVYDYSTTSKFVWDDTYFGINKAGIDGFSLTGSVVDDTETDTLDSSEFWLIRIYNAIVDGFNGVFDRLSGSGSDLNVDEDLEIDDPETEENEGFSIGDIVSSLFSAIKSVLAGFWKLISGAIVDLVSGISDMFGALSDTTNDIFGMFDDEDGTFSDVSNFFQFMNNLWACVPTPIQLFVYFSFSAFVVFALFKMFH